MQSGQNECPGLEDSARPVIDPFVLFSHIAAVTSRIGLAAGIMVLPQRQAVLVAKQAAGVDVLRGGRLRLNLSVGWNDLEYRSVNEDFHNRGKRMEEQVDAICSENCWRFLGINPKFEKKEERAPYRTPIGFYRPDSLGSRRMMQHGARAAHLVWAKRARCTSGARFRTRYGDE